MIDLHFHALRREAGPRMLEAGWPLHHLQEMLGRADLKQTSTYLNVTRIGAAGFDASLRAKRSTSPPMLCAAS